MTRGDLAEGQNPLHRSTNAPRRILIPDAGTVSGAPQALGLSLLKQVSRSTDKTQGSNA